MPGSNMPYDPLNFYPLVWDVVRQVPPGKVTTYGRVAARIPPPVHVAPETYKAFGARWVGAAMAACPEDVPWQRVVNSEGKISQRGGAEHQRRLLEAEGVQFDASGCIDLRRFGWEEGPSGLQQESLF